MTTKIEKFPKLDKGLGKPEELIGRAVKFCNDVEKWKEKRVAQLRDRCHTCNAVLETKKICDQICSQKLTPKKLLEAFEDG